MTIPLFTIGDSLAQGFMSLASARGDQAYSTRIAEAMGIPPGNYRYAKWHMDVSTPTDVTWAKGGHPIHIERLIRALEKDAFVTIIGTIEQTLKEVDAYYVAGDGNTSLPDPSGLDYFHNIAVRGFSIADAWQVTAKLSLDRIARENVIPIAGGGVRLLDSSFYRTALRVLNPSRDPRYEEFSQLDWVEALHLGSEGPIENLIAPLGPNNALGTVLSLSVRATDDPGSNYDPGMDHFQRDKFNLWSPKHFAIDYDRYLGEIDRAMAPGGNDWRVFLQTVPPVTAAPLLQGGGASRLRPDPLRPGRQVRYFDHYSYFFLVGGDDPPRWHLTGEQVYRIDGYIAEYNREIVRQAAAMNRRHGVARYIVVDIASALAAAGWQRNDGVSDYVLPQPLRDLPRPPDTRFYRTDGVKVTEGGLFGLDGVHPSSMGYGVMAHEYLAAINAARGTNHALYWPTIISTDGPYDRPIKGMPRMLGLLKAMGTIFEIVSATLSRGGERVKP